MPKDPVLPHDDKMTTARCFEVSRVVKEKTFDENPRRHWREAEMALQEQLVQSLIEHCAIRQSVTPTDKTGEYKIHLKLWALIDEPASPK